MEGGDCIWKYQVHQGTKMLLVILLYHKFLRTKVHLRAAIQKAANLINF
jgi:hypothetical protein